MTTPAGPAITRKVMDRPPAGADHGWYDGGTAVARVARAAPASPVELAVGSGVTRFFSVASRIEMPNDSTVEGLRLETFLPADEATRAALRH